MKELTEKVALKWLEETAKTVSSEYSIIELGVYQGGSLVHLAKGAKHGNKAQVFGVDPWGLPGAYPDRPHMMRRYGIQNQAIAKLAVKNYDVTLIQDFSWAVGAKWTGPKVGLLYIDALHTEQAVLIDYTAWAPHLAKGCIVAYDDYCDRFSGVKAAVQRLHGDQFEIIGNRLAVARFN